MDPTQLVAVFVALGSFLVPFVVINGLVSRVLWAAGVRGEGVVDGLASTAGLALAVVITAALHLMTPLGTASAPLWSAV